MKAQKKITAVEKAVERMPEKTHLFFNQFKRVPAKIVEVRMNGDIVADYGFGDANRGGMKLLKFREIEWDARAKWWIFKEEKKEYHVWVETVASENSDTKRGVWEKAVNFPLSQSTANAIEKLLKNENPELEFATSLGKPSSYFI